MQTSGCKHSPSHINASVKDALVFLREATGWAMLLFKYWHSRKQFKEMELIVTSPIATCFTFGPGREKRKASSLKHYLWHIEGR